MGHRLRHGRRRTLIDAHRRFVLAETRLAPVPFVPEISLYQADEATSLWHRTARELERDDMPPPFWAFAWAGGQGLARYLLDNPGVVAGRPVLDFATGSGLVAIAAARCGASPVLASDIDPFCGAAVALNAPANGVAIDFVSADLIGDDRGWGVVLAGDVFYEKPLADRLVPWFSALAARGAAVLVGDPGRSYLPKDRLALLADYQVPVSRALEDSEVKRTRVWRFA